MESVVVYGIGSPVLVDLEESLFRAGISIAAGVRNYEGESFLAPEVKTLSPQTLTHDFTSLPFLIPLFTPGHRQRAAIEAESFGFARPYSLVDPTSATPRSLQIEPGTYINSGCSIGAQSRFGAFVFINRGVAIGHHADFGPFVSIGPGAVIAGGVKIGKGALVGAGAVVLPEIAIGENAVVGAGSVVTRDVPAHCLVVGNPAKIVKEGIAGHNGIAVV